MMRHSEHERGVAHPPLFLNFAPTASAMTGVAWHSAGWPVQSPDHFWNT